MLWYSIEASQQGTSNEYPQCMFLLKNKKNIKWIPILPAVITNPIIFTVILFVLFFEALGKLQKTET